MWAQPPSAGRQHHKIMDFLSVDDADEEEKPSGCWRAAAAGTVFCPAAGCPDVEKHSYEVTLDVTGDEVVIGGTPPPPPQSRQSSRNQSPAPTSRMRRKLASWLTTPSPARQLSQLLQMPEADGAAAPRLTAREARRAQARLDRARSGAEAALDGLRFISKKTTTTATASASSSSGGSGPSTSPEDMWREVEARFRGLATDGMLSRDDFAECIGMADSKEFANRIYDALARREQHKPERITKDELRCFWLQISDDSFDARLQIFFDMVDANADGRITREEVQELIILSASANKLSKLKDQAQEYAALIMEELDRERLGYIELWQLEALLLQKEHYLKNSMPLNLGRGGNLSGLISKPKGLLRQLTSSFCCVILDNWKRMWVMLIWLVAMAALFTWKFMYYQRSPAFHVLGNCLPTAKGAAETLKLNMALVLLPVCRNTLTWLRSTRARLVIPFDDNINFHKIIAAAIVVGVLVHATNHLACDFPRLIRATPQAYRPIAADFGSRKPTFLGLVTSIEGTTGIAMVLLMCVAFTLATSGFRKHGGSLPFPLNRMTGFNTFWYSHHLFVLVYLLLVIHGYFMFLVHEWYERTTWMYLAVPVMLYLGERTLRSLRSEAFAVKILKVAVLPGNVLTLLMSKPQGFRYRSGQYIFLKCPSISPFEWHPFSITSAPGDDHLSVHIKTVGDWTRELRQVFTDLGNTHNVIGRAKLNESGLIDDKCLPRLLVDGPYGAPAQNYKNYDVLLLLGLGIGATPFISILRDLLNNIKLCDEQESGMDDNKAFTATMGGGGGSSSSRKKPRRTTNAYFYWVTREPSSFEWFKGVMDEVAEMDHQGVIEMHNHLTGVYQEGDARTTLLAMIQAINHAKTGVDIVSGTRVRTHFARPNWNQVFSRIATKHPGATVGVFYCGNGMLAKEVKKLSHELTHKTRTRFCFHKESL